MSLGVGAMLGFLGGNARTVEAIKQSLNKTIENVKLADALYLIFVDGTQLKIYDDGQSCCESRYIVCDDDLESFRGSVFLDILIKDAPDIEDGGEVHEVQFLEIITNNGTFVCSNHNEHNGYYGGFWIVAELIKTEIE